ncbi:hypothetical protein HIM_06859 [Hirsutella minnesotensis 3608]|uniref:Uncharacterized protein n=1 Tax=Hirsutella minnesotensis 3608 TaxID=1043627 RepID=A0A0F7ZII9_9HYPO|nr:hypothetical protein HIM_06859 [Hirsutella minnesotensis 3608]
MADDIDQSLLTRLAALRASSATPERPSAPRINIDTIERAKTPTREDALADRLKRLREQAAAPSPASSSPPAKSSQAPPTLASRSRDGTSPSRDTPRAPPDLADDEADALFRTDDRTLEELLLGESDDDGGASAPLEPREQDVRALLEELAAAVPRDDDAQGGRTEGDSVERGGSDDSDGEHMAKEVDEVVARFKDEVELDSALDTYQDADSSSPPSHKPREPGDMSNEQPDDATAQDPNLSLPSLPPNLAPLPPAAPSNALHQDITTRLAALRAPSSSSPSAQKDGIPADVSLPSVPSARPARRSLLTSRTAYTDDDVDSW